MPYRNRIATTKALVRRIWSSLLLFVLLWPLSVRAEEPSTPPEWTVPMETVLGEPIRIADFRGKVVVINFWATWCPPCLKEIPSFVRFQEEFRDRVVVLGVDYMERPDRKELADFIRQTGINYPVVYGDATKSQALARALGGVLGLPTTKLLDQDGRMVASHTGGLDEQRLREWALPLLSRPARIVP
jgi:cytochrome c biogenesis protein CcmG/thiol:disulfide interchange protein DsbE